MALTQITSEGIKDSEVKTADILNANVTTAKLADGSVTNAKLADESVSTVKIGDGQVTEAKLATDAITTTKIADDAITSALIADNAVLTAAINADAVTGAKIADDAINSEHYTDGSIDTAHIAADQITGALIADDAVGAEHIEVLDANLQFGDSVKAQFGASNDLEIYHNGSASFISDTGTGDLLLLSSQVQIVNPANSEAIAKFTENGSCELYYDNSKKFETLSNGNRNTGYLSFLDGSTNAILMGTGNDLQIYHSGSHGYITEGTGNLKISAASGPVQILKGSSEDIAKFTPDGSCELYYNNVKTFETRSDGIKIIGSENGYAALEFNADEGDDNADKWLQYASTDGKMHIKNYSSGSWEDSIVAVGDGAIELYHDNGKRLQTGSGGIDILGDEGEDCDVYIYADEGDDVADRWRLHAEADSSMFTVDNQASGSWGNSIKAHGGGSVELYHNDYKKFETYASGCIVTGELHVSSHLVMEDSDIIKLGSSADLQIQYNGSNAYISCGNAGDMYIGNVHGANQINFNNGNATRFVINSSTIFPYVNDSYDLGLSSYKFDDVYATNGTIQTSDKNTKNTIVDSDLGLSFVNKLKPVSYKFNGKTRTHYGLIAQDVETILSDISKSTADFAGFIKEDIPDTFYHEARDEHTIPEGKKAGDIKKAAYTTYGLRYNEFISPLIKAVQELSTEVETLKTKVAALEAA